MTTTPAHTAYLRHPDVHDEQVVFTAANDLWIAPLGGGHAWRVTDDGDPVSYPFFSPDGSHIAYTSRASGGAEVWVLPVDGSDEPRRLTAWGRANTRSAGWLPDGRVLVTSSYGAPMARDAVLWGIALDGTATLLPLGRSGEAAIHPSGTTVVTTPWRREPAGWKHYQGGTAAKLWISREDVPLDADEQAHAERSWEPLLDELLASKTRIAWYGDRLLFASDTPGLGASRTDRASGNLWSVAMDGTDLQVHTHLTSEQGYLREPATDGSSIVFTSRGRLFAMDALDAEPREVEVITAGVGAHRRPRPAKPTENLLAMRPVHDARSSVVEWRGSAHLLTHRGGPSRVLAARDGVRIREVRPLGRSPYALAVTDQDAADRSSGGVASDKLLLTQLDGCGEPTVLDVGEIGRILHAVPSPDGRSVALATHDDTVHLVTLTGIEDPAGEPRPIEETAAQETAGPERSDAAASATTARAWGQDSALPQRTPSVQQVVQLDRSTGGEVEHLAWSPDSRYLVWARPNSWQLGRLLICDTSASTPEVRELTSGRYQDSCPAFSADGKHLALLSLRTFETMYDDMVFDLGFVNAERPFLIPLEATTADPFGPHPDGWGADDAGADSGTGGTGSGASTEKGATGTSAAAQSTPEAAADRPVGADSPAGAKDAAAPAATVVDMAGIESRIIPFPVESGLYSQLTAVKDGFVWLRHPQMGVLGSARAGVEGDAPAPRLEHWSLPQRKLTVLAEGVTAVAASGDGETLVVRQGEAWVQIPATRAVEKDDAARVEIDVERLRLVVDPVAERRGMLWDNYRIMAQQYWREDMDGQDWHAMTSWYDSTVDRLVTADDFQDMMWEVVGELGTSHAYVQGAPHAVDSPMPAALLGADVVEQDGRWVIERILPGDSSDPDARSPLLAPGVAAREGDAIVRIDGREVGADGIAPLLLGSGDRPTELVLERDGEHRRVVVVPLSDDAALRYQDWVASRREAVAELSGGRLGYLHIPDMVSSGWAQMHRDLREASTKDGIVVDVRYNGGGHTSQLVTDRLARRVLSWDYPRHQEPGTYPQFAPRGAVVLVTNQEAGSDGDIVNAVAKAMRIGPVIGTRTWGGVIGIDGRYDLVDGTGITQPKYASWFEGVDWEIENYGVDPDIEVPFPPNAWVSGADPQLERGVQEALALLEQTPASAAPPLPPARFSRD